ncbi:cellulose synthase subunit [Paraburkholderia caballeronis]|nr:cellulose synthase subunit [Paraburkholderia caballeronis]TDV13796.1 cellulose synthase subunit [Paraburkholderia caballeronis]TDV22978.1 cellulose synthase subunit [Paraburkholderia caballeronis]
MGHKDVTSNLTAPRRAFERVVPAVGDMRIAAACARPRARRTTFRAVFSTVFAVLAAILTTPAHAAPGDLAAAFAQLGAGRVESRTVSLADLGVREPILLRAPDASQELYFPVPLGLPVSNATLQLDGGYLHGDGGRTTFVLSLDGSPVLARSVTDAQGDGAVNIGVDGSPRPSGFVRVGVQWSSVIDDNVCADQTAIGNLWRIAPTSRLTYQYDTSAIGDVRGAWSALPPKPVVAVGGGRLGAPAYDVAWRVESLLMRAGAEPVVQVVPAVGDTVSLAGASVPAALQAVPAFAALASGGQHRLANPAELGALVALAPAGAFAPNVVIADDALRARLGEAFDALRAEVAGVSPDAAAAFDAWRSGAAGPLGGGAPVAGDVGVARLGGQPVVVVGDTAGVAALSRTWTPLDVSNRLVVHALDRAPNLSAGGDTDRLALSLVGGAPRTLDVLTSASWDATFDLAAVSGNGKVPRAVVLDLAAAAASVRNAQTASIFFNGVLIGSRLLSTDGRPQRVSAAIPGYALGSVNQLRVLFQRQPEGGCQPRAAGYPAAVLPGSHLVLGEGRLEDNFTGMIVRYAQSANLLVPDAYLANPADSLPRVARLANAVGIAPTRATLAVVAGGQAAQPAGPFLAADVAVTDLSGPATFDGGRLTIKGRSGAPLADVAGLTRLGVLEVVHSGGTTGVLYRTVGAAAPVLPATLQLLSGDIVVVDATGALKSFDTQRPGGVPPEDRQRAWLTQHWSAWGVPALAIVVLLLLIFAANAARRRRREKNGGPGEPPPASGSSAPSAPPPPGPDGGVATPGAAESSGSPAEPGAPGTPGKPGKPGEGPPDTPPHDRQG